MEFCGAGSVCDMMKICDKTLTEDQIAVVSKDVLNGLHYLHNMRKIHRDIKVRFSQHIFAFGLLYIYAGG